MRSIALILAAALLSGCGSLRSTAHQAIAADAGTTVVGVVSGAAAEANPLIGSVGAGIASVAVRIAAVEYANTLDEPKRTNSLAGINSVTWGVVANNVCAIAGAVPALSIACGLVAGALVWDSTREEREFAQICASEKARNPSITSCTYTKPT